jgi:hypothetical protein
LTQGVKKKIHPKAGTGGWLKVVKHLLSKRETLSSNTSFTDKKKKNLLAKIRV